MPTRKIQLRRSDGRVQLKSKHPRRSTVASALILTIVVGSCVSLLLSNLLDLSITFIAAIYLLTFFGFQRFLLLGNNNLSTTIHQRANRTQSSAHDEDEIDEFNGYIKNPLFTDPTFSHVRGNIYHTDDD